MGNIVSVAEQIEKEEEAALAAAAKVSAVVGVGLVVG